MVRNHTAHHRQILLVILAAFFMYGFDGNVVNVALSSFQHELHAGQVALELVVGGYVFGYATALTTGGRLGDLLGHRRMFLLGVTGFTVASALCSVAQNPAELVGGRLLQGLAAAVIVPQVLALITSTFPAGERPRALSWYGVTGGLSGICGQVLGGLLLVADLFGLGWRIIFLINVPVGLIVLACALRVLPRTRTRHRADLDLVGVLAVSGSFALALVPLVLGRDLGWPPWAWALLACSVPAMAAALRWERRLSAAGGQPLLDIGLFRNRVFNLGLAVNAAFMVFFPSSTFVLSLVLQNGLGLSALRAGLCFAPMAMLAMAGSLGGRRLGRRLGIRVLTVGCLVIASSLLLAAVALQLPDDRITVTWLVVSLALRGLGSGLVLPSLVGTALAGVRPDQAGAASGLLATTQQFAGVTGLAVMGALLFTALGSNPGRADYAGAAQLTLSVALFLVALMIVLVQVLTRATAAASPVISAPAENEQRADT
jgi:EmrB/QacA subfamily drug resistance transporter